MKSLSRLSQVVLLAVAWMTVCSASAQAQAPPNQQFGKAMVENAVELRQYTFKQRTEVSMNGEVRSVKLDHVRFDRDGNLERIPLTPVAAEAPKARGLRGKVVAKKREETADYVERLMSCSLRAGSQIASGNDRARRIVDQSQHESIYAPMFT